MTKLSRKRPIGVLLTNLGTPNSTATGDIRRYLAEFLSDPRVVDLNRALWLPVLYGYVLTTRPPKTAAAYRKVWTDEGSPLLVIARKQADALQRHLTDTLDMPTQVALAMRYGQPSLADGLQKLRAAGCQRIILLPMYPQYSATTTATTFDRVAKLLATQVEQPAVHSIMRYADEPAYIDALADSVRAHWQAEGRGDKLMLSFHGIPQRYADNGDPYPHDCDTTGRLLAEQLQLADGEWRLCYQSRFGREPWLQPYTDKTLVAWAEQGVKRVDVICPGFSADCVETLEEIALTNRELFIANGGQELAYIPALNDRPQHIDMLAGLIRREAAGWLSPDQLNTKDAVHGITN